MLEPLHEQANLYVLTILLGNMSVKGIAMKVNYEVDIRSRSWEGKANSNPPSGEWLVAVGALEREH